MNYSICFYNNLLFGNNFVRAFLNHVKNNNMDNKVKIVPSHKIEGNYH